MDGDEVGQDVDIDTVEGGQGGRRGHGSRVRRGRATAVTSAQGGEVVLPPGHASTADGVDGADVGPSVDIGYRGRENTGSGGLGAWCRRETATLLGVWMRWRCERMWCAACIAAVHGLGFGGSVHGAAGTVQGGARPCASGAARLSTAPARLDILSNTWWACESGWEEEGGRAAGPAEVRRKESRLRLPEGESLRRKNRLGWNGLGW
uniref:Uncharacterized protein n=1 Tax=Oryza meridionalis TaxID=40149 RepID=A0A0E0E012_9ORYZ